MTRNLPHPPPSTAETTLSPPRAHEALPGLAAPGPTHHEVMPNGLKILLRESHRAPVVELQIWADVGSADERPGEEGLAHFHEHMLFKGTSRRDVGEVAGDIEGLGGQINAYTSFDQTVYHATLPAAAWREGLDVLVDAVRFSIFDTGEVEREREVVLEEIRRSDDTPAHVLGDLAFRACYRVHRYGAPILGPAENVASFDRERVRRFFERWYTPDRLMVVAVGDFDAAEVAEEIRRHFADAEKGSAQRERVIEPPQDAPQVQVVRRHFEGHRVDLSWPAARFSDHDALHLDLLAYVLGECESSRLVQAIRENEGLVDRIDAGAYTPLDRGLFSIDFETDAERLLAATRRIVEETDRLRREPVGDDELERARINFLASEQFERESVSGVASRIGSYEVMGGGWERESEALQILRSATPADLQAVAQRYLDPRGLTVSALVPDSTDPTLDDETLREAIEQGLVAAHAPRSPGTHEEPDDVAAASTLPPSSRQRDARVPLRFSPPRATAGGAEQRLDATLDNGLSVHVLRRPEVPIAAVRLAFPGGLLAEQETTSGRTRFLAAMWTRGTESLSAAQFARRTEALAADIDGFAGRNSLGLSLDCLSESLEPALDLLAETLLAPRFDPEEIERERRETLAAIDRRADRLGQLAFQHFARTEFDAHPYRLTVLGERDAVAALDRASLEAQADSLIRADRAAIALVGDVDPEKVARVIEDRLGALPGGGGAFPLPDAPARAVGVREATLHKDREQAHLVVGFRGLAFDDPDRITLELIAQLLAGQGGRLFLDLRDRQSLAYTVSASNVEGLLPGYFSIYIATAPEKLDRARAGIFAEVDRLVSQAPEADELARAIRFGTGSFAIESQRSHGRAAHLALDSIYGLGPDLVESYPERIAAVTPEDILRVAQRVFRQNACTIAAVHP